MPTALSTINIAKEQAATYQPLLLAEFTFADGAVLRLSTHPLNTSEGGVQYGGNDYLGRISEQSIQQVQALSETGVDLIPNVTLSIADPASYIYTNWEAATGRGFKGATLTLRLVFYNIAAGTFSSDYRIPFVGVCEKPSSDAAKLTVSAVAKTGLMRALLPIVPIQQRCPWINPTTSAQRATASNEDSPFYECGETRDTTTAPPCSYTKATCTQANRFGGITYSAPAGMRVREYVSGNWSDVRGITNEASYGDRIPMVYGTAWIEPPVLTAIPDGNYLRGECIVALGPVDIQKVTVNGVLLAAANEPDGTPLSGANPDFRYNWINDGTRDGSPNLDTPWSGNGDPYGSMSAIMFVLPRSQGGGDGVPRVRVLAKRKRLRKYVKLTQVVVASNVATATMVVPNVDLASNDPAYSFTISGTTGTALNATWTGLTNWTAGPPGTFQFTTSGVADGTYTGGMVRYESSTENVAWAIADLLTWTNYSYDDLDLESFCDAALVLESRPCSFVLRQRRSAAEIIRALRQAFGLLLVPEHSTGKLKLQVKQTLSDQQPATISGSNYDTAVASVTAGGTVTNGYVAYRFDAGSILRSDLPVSLKELPRTSGDSPNRITVSFQDRNNDYAISTLSVVDSDDSGRMDGQEITGGLAVTPDGLTSYDDAMRAARVGLAEIHRGNAGADTRGTRVFEWDTTFRALHLRVGHLVLLNDTLKGLTNQLVRITKIQPSQNYETVRLTAHWHTDEWYTDDFAATGVLDDVEYTAPPVSEASPPDIGGTVGSNLIKNAGFEAGKIQWHGDIDNADVEIVTDTYDSGLQCLKISATGATEIHQPYDFQDGKYDTLPCAEGQTFTFTGRYKFDADSAASVAEARIAFYDASGNYLDAGTATLDTAETGWTDFSLTATAPATAKYLGIFPWFGTLTAGAVYLDTLYAEKTAVGTGESPASPQPSAEDWSIGSVIYTVDANGIRKVGLPVNVLSIPSGADYVRVWIEIDGEYRGELTAATTGTHTIWLDHPAVATDYPCVLVGNRRDTAEVPSEANDVKTFEVQAWGKPLALSTFTVTAQAFEDYQGKGVTMYRLKYEVTGPTDINRRGVIVFRRWTDEEFDPLSGDDGLWKIVSESPKMEGSNSATWFSSDEPTFGAPTAGTEYTQMAAVAIDHAGNYDFDDAVAVNLTRTADGGIKATAIDTSTLGAALGIVDGKLAVQAGDGLTVTNANQLANLVRSQLVNGSFEFGLDGWTIWEDSHTSITTSDFKEGTQCCRVDACSAFAGPVQRFAWKQGQTMKLSAWVKADCNGTPAMWISYHDANDDTVSESSYEFTKDGEWHLVTLTMKAPANAVAVRVFPALVGNDTTTGYLLVDLVSAVQVSVDLGFAENFNTSEFEVVGATFRTKSIAADKIYVGSVLRVGGGSGAYVATFGGNANGQIACYNASNALVGWVGTQGGYYGGWFKQLYVGGSDPSTAKIYADANGNTYILGTTFVLDLNGVRASIENTYDNNYGAYAGIIVKNSENNQRTIMTAGGVACLNSNNYINVEMSANSSTGGSMGFRNETGTQTLAFYGKYGSIRLGYEIQDLNGVSLVSGDPPTGWSDPSTDYSTGIVTSSTVSLANLAKAFNGLVRALRYHGLLRT